MVFAPALVLTLVSAFRSSRSCTDSILPLRAARIRMLSPLSRSTPFTSAPASTRIRMESVSPVCAAQASGVSPLMSFTSMSASASTRMASVSGVPSPAAQRAELPPIRSRLLTSAPASTRNWVIFTWPDSAAKSSGVLPARSPASMSAPASIRYSTTSKWLPFTAQCRGVRPPLVSGALGSAPSATSSLIRARSPDRAAPLRSLIWRVFAGVVGLSPTLFAREARDFRLTRVVTCLALGWSRLKATFTGRPASSHAAQSIWRVWESAGSSEKPLTTAGLAEVMTNGVPSTEVRTISSLRGSSSIRAGTMSGLIDTYSATSPSTRSTCEG